MSDNNLKTGLWKNEPGKPAGYGGKIEITEPGWYWVNLYKNDRKETDKHPDLNLVLKPKDAPKAGGHGKPAPSHDADPDDDIPFISARGMF